MALNITVEFAGGLETLFPPSKSQTLALEPREDGKIWTVGLLVEYLRTQKLKGDENMFVLDGRVRPGILVLINEADWELEGEEEYELEEKDVVLFVSTLHGG